MPGERVAPWPGTIGGLVTATLLTPLVLPTLYVMVERWSVAYEDVREEEEPGEATPYPGPALPV